MNKKKLRMLEICCLYYFVIRANFLGITSNNILHLARQDGWISILIGTLLGLIPLCTFLFIQNKFPNDTIFSITKKLFGTTIGKIINGILVIGTFLSITITFYDLVGFIASQYLNRTPTLAIAIMFFLAITYILTKGITVIARTHVILLYFGIILFLLALFGLSGEISFANIKPMLESGWKPIFNGSMSFIAFNVLPIFVLTSIPKNYVFDTKHYHRNIFIAYLLGSFSLFTTLFFILSIFGPNLALLYQYPEFHLLKLITLGGFITRVEGIIALHWLFDLFAFIVIGLYFVTQYIKDDWCLKDKFGNPFIILISILLIFATEHIFKNNTIANFIVLHYSPFINFCFFAFIPFIILLRSITYKKT